MSHNGFNALERLSERERRPIAELVRQALEEFTEKHGEKADFRVEWGGNRRKTEDENS